MDPGLGLGSGLALGLGLGLTFVHEMGGEDDDAVLAVRLDHIPGAPPGPRVHAGRRLVQQNHLWGGG